MRGLRQRIWNWYIKRRRQGLDEWASYQYNTIDWAARAIFYPRQWDKEAARRRPVVEHMVECVGVTEADVKELRYRSTRDAIIVRLWNWRTFEVDGLHLWQHEENHYPREGKNQW